MPSAVILMPNVVVLDSIQDPCSNLKMDSGPESNAPARIGPGCTCRQNDGSTSLSWKIQPC
jgi:hypothetical protein